MYFPQFFSPLAWASYQIRKIAGCACAGNAGNVSPRIRIQRKPRVSDPGMHHGTCVTHVPWCMSGLLTCDGGENVPDIPDACAPAIWRICQEAHEAVGTQGQCHRRMKNKLNDIHLRSHFKSVKFKCVFTKSTTQQYWPSKILWVFTIIYCAIVTHGYARLSQFSSELNVYILQ